MGWEFPRLSTPPARDLTPQTTRGFEAITVAEEVLGAGAPRLCSRQAGKSTLLRVLALWRLYCDGARLVLGTAQNLPLAEETWQGALSMAESGPGLAAELAHVSRQNGDTYLRLVGGERYEVTAATRSGGRGLSSDLGPARRAA